MKLRERKIISVLAVLILLAGLLPGRAYALGAVDLRRPVTLTVRYQPGGKAAPGVDFALYRVADVSKDMAYTLTGDFKDYPVSLAAQTTGEWRTLAATLAGYVQLDGLTPLDSGKTGPEGTLTFPTGGKTLTPGLYLVIGGQYTDGSKTYRAEPFLVALPSLNDAGTQWLYNVTVTPKYTEHENETPPGGTVSRRVLKVWNDGGNAGSRPGSVTVYLLRNGQLYDTVTLSGANNWGHTWNGLDANSQWAVVERPVPGYTVTVSQEGATFVVTNTSQSGGPDDPGPGPSGDPDPTDSPRPSDGPNPSDNPRPSDGPGPSDNPQPSGGPNPSDGPHDPTVHPSLPQTGVLWWPVPVLLAAGLVLIIVGFVRRRSGDEE